MHTQTHIHTSMHKCIVLLIYIYKYI